MTAFDTAWHLLKMPIYHGTSSKHLPTIMSEGLKPTSEIPYTHYQQLTEDFGYPEDHKDFFTDWLYGVDNSLLDPADYAIGQANAPFADPKTGEVLDEEDRVFSPDNLPVILEMPYDSGGNEWVNDPIGKHGWGNDGWVRTTQTVSPDELKVFAQATPDMTVGQFLEMIAEKNREMGYER